jgi:hypothetical protein
MDRRTFLASMGFGGLALTVPRPLQVVAAALGDVEGPPLHAVMCRFRGLEGVAIDRLFLRRLNPAIRENALSDMMVRAVIRRGAESYVPLVSGDAAPHSGENLCIEDPTMFFHPYVRPAPLVSPGARLQFSKDDVVDVWLAPKRPMSRLVPPMEALLCVPDDAKFWRAKIVRSASFRTVRLERARAIELGLAQPDEAFEWV